MYLHFQTNRSASYLNKRCPQHQQLQENRGAAPVIATPSSTAAHDSVVAPAAARDSVVDATPDFLAGADSSVVAPAAARDSVVDATPDFLAGADSSVVAPYSVRDSVADTTSSPNVSDGLAPDTRPPP